MSEVRKFVIATVRLVGIAVAGYGLLGFVGVAVMGQRLAGQNPMGSGLVGMAAGGALMTVAIGLVIFFLASPVSRLATFDMD